MPKLVVDEDTAVCSPMLKAVTAAFFHERAGTWPLFDIDVSDRDWPGAKVEWIFPRTNADAGFGDAKSGAFAWQAVEADLDGDRKREVLTLVAWVHSWRGYNYALTRHPNLAAQRAAVAKAKFGTDFGAGGNSGFDGVETSGSDNQLGWRWARPWVVKVNGGYYLLDAGELASALPTISLRKIGAKGPLREICRVLKWREAPQGDFQTFLAFLDQIAGRDGSCSGTLLPNSRIEVQQPNIRAAAVTRPWAVPNKPYNSRRKVDVALKAWRLDGLWNYRQYRRFRALEKRALAALAADYGRSFGVPVAAAQREAARVLDLAVRHRFVLSLSQTEPDPEAKPRLREQLEALILTGGSVQRIVKLFPEAISDEQQFAPYQCDAGMEPPLFSALERPDVMIALLDAGALIEERNGFGKTALMAAAHYDLVPAARLLLSKKADVNARLSADAPYSINFTDRTALMYAAENAHLPMIRLLVEAGADARAVDNFKRDVFNYLGRNVVMTNREREQAAAYLNAALSRPRP